MPSLETADSRLLKVVRRDARPHTRWELTRAFPDDVDSLRVMGKSSVYSDSRNRIRGGTVEEIIENHKLTAGKQLNSNRYFFKKTVRRIERLINDKKLDLNTATLILDFFTDYINNYGISAEDFNRIKPLVEKCSHGLFENNQENPSGFQTLARNLHAIKNNIDGEIAKQHASIVLGSIDIPSITLKSHGPDLLVDILGVVLSFDQKADNNVETILKDLKVSILVNDPNLSSESLIQAANFLLEYKILSDDEQTAYIRAIGSALVNREGDLSVDNLVETLRLGQEYPEFKPLIKSLQIELNARVQIEPSCIKDYSSYDLFPLLKDLGDLSCLELRVALGNGFCVNRRRDPEMRKIHCEFFVWAREIEKTEGVRRKLNVIFNSLGVKGEIESYIKLLTTSGDPSLSLKDKRLRCLGKELLRLALAEGLYHNFPDWQPGELSSAREVLSRKISLKECLKKIATDYSDGNKKLIFVLFGSILNDLGFEMAKRFVFAVLNDQISKVQRLSSRMRCISWCIENNKVFPKLKFVRNYDGSEDRRIVIKIGNCLLAGGRFRNIGEAEKEEVWDLAYEKLRQMSQRRISSLPRPHLPRRV